MALDRPDLQYASKETSRSMARPTVESMASLKRIGRYLKHTARAAWVLTFTVIVITRVV